MLNSIKRASSENSENNIKKRLSKGQSPLNKCPLHVITEILGFLNLKER